MNFEKDILRHYNYLKGFAIKLCKDLDMAEDLVQETYCKALEKKHLFIKGSNTSSWLGTILKNTYLDIKRKDQIFYEYNLELYSKSSNDLPDSDLNIDDILSEVENLPNCLKSTFKLRILGYNYQDICEMLNMKENTARGNVRRSRIILSVNLNKF